MKRVIALALVLTACNSKPHYYKCRAVGILGAITATSKIEFKSQEEAEASFKDAVSQIPVLADAKVTCEVLK